MGESYNSWGGGDVPDAETSGRGHKANIEKSERLQRTLRFIKSFGRFGVTSAMIQGHTGSVAVATDASELRRNGYRIDCDYVGKNSHGRKLFRYTYKGKKENA